MDRKRLEARQLSISCLLYLFETKGWEVFPFADDEFVVIVGKLVFDIIVRAFLVNQS